MAVGSTQALARSREGLNRSPAAPQHASERWPQLGMPSAWWWPACPWIWAATRTTATGRQPATQNRRGSGLSSVRRPAPLHTHHRTRLRGRVKPHGDHPHRPRPTATRRPHRRRRAHRPPPGGRGEYRGLQQRDRGPRHLRHGHLAHQRPAHRPPPRLDPAPGSHHRPLPHQPGPRPPLARRNRRMGPPRLRSPGRPPRQLRPRLPRPPRSRISPAPPPWSTGPGQPAEQPGSTPATGPSGSSPPDIPRPPPSTGPPKSPPGARHPPRASPPSPQPTPTSGPRSATPTPARGPCASRLPPTPGTHTGRLAERRSAGCHQPSRQCKARIPVYCSTGILACCALSRIRTGNLLVRSSSRIGHRWSYRPLRGRGEVVANGGGCRGCGTPLLYISSSLRGTLRITSPSSALVLGQRIIRRQEIRPRLPKGKSCFLTVRSRRRQIRRYAH